MRSQLHLEARRYESNEQEPYYIGIALDRLEQAPRSMPGLQRLICYGISRAAWDEHRDVLSIK